MTLYSRKRGLVSSFDSVNRVYCGAFEQIVYPETRHLINASITITWVVSRLARSDAPNITWAVSRLARSDTPNITWAVLRLARSDTPNITLVVSRLARSDTPNITWVVSHRACSDTPNITWVVSCLARSDTPNITWVGTDALGAKFNPLPQPPSAASVHCMHIHIFNKVAVA